ncbi:MAG: formyltetrahydrofolate deformylase [Rhodospirillales bacterium]|nr:formyltetrahydrofolate deformylase [Rhodospirillales bacterium]
MNDTQHVLCLNCKDQPGIVAAVATTLRDQNCNIEESAQFHDPFSEQFFMRVVFTPLSDEAKYNFAQNFTEQAQKLSISWKIHDLVQPVKTLLLVSKADHCLNDLLYRWRTHYLNIDITGIVSNHDRHRKLAEDRDLTFHHLPVNPENKAEQEAAIQKLIEDKNAELIVLARYMQILSPEMCEKYTGRIINIHHSFLPGFKGAKPYHQAYERGVKIIGATAHFATGDLDEGPIIEQETVRITHADTPKRLQLIGRDTESKVLARAIALYTERRIFLHGQRTIVL